MVSEAILTWRRKPAGNCCGESGGRKSPGWSTTGQTLPELGALLSRKYLRHLLLQGDLAGEPLGMRRRELLLQGLDLLLIGRVRKQLSLQLPVCGGRGVPATAPARPPRLASTAVGRALRLANRADLFALLRRQIDAAQARHEPAAARAAAAARTRLSFLKRAKAANAAAAIRLGISQ